MSRISFVVAIYKNEDNIIPFYEDFVVNIAPVIREQGDDYEIVLTNDDSPDGSWEIMKALAMKDSHVKILRLSRNFGALQAIFSAYRYVSGDCIILKACDLQEPPWLAVNMYREWKKGERIVLAVREGRNDGFFCDMAANLYYWLVRKFVDKNMPKGGFDSWMIDRGVKEQILQMNDKNSNIGLQLLWLGYHPKKIFYLRLERKIGKSSWTFSKKLKLFIDSLVGFSYVPIRIMSMFGACFVVFALTFGFWVIWAKLNGLIEVPGYTTLLVIVLFSSGMVMFTLGVLGEYIWRTLEASRNRPISVVQDAINFDDKPMRDGGVIKCEMKNSM